MTTCMLHAAARAAKPQNPEHLLQTLAKQTGMGQSGLIVRILGFVHKKVAGNPIIFSLCFAWSHWPGHASFSSAFIWQGRGRNAVLSLPFSRLMWNVLLEQLWGWDAYLCGCLWRCVLKGAAAWELISGLRAELALSSV